MRGRARPFLDDGLPPELAAAAVGTTQVGQMANYKLARYKKAGPMTVYELIEELRAMPSNATVMAWSRMDDPQHREIERVELSTTKSDPTPEMLCFPDCMSMRSAGAFSVGASGTLIRTSVQRIRTSRLPMPGDGADRDGMAR
jgi:hypothetical protein